MATSKPRITVTLSDRQHEVLKAIGSMGGQSMSQIVGELVELSLPTLERMAATFQALRKATQEERAKMLAVMDEAQRVIEPVVMDSVDQFDMFLGKVEAISGGTTQAETGGADTASDVPRRIGPPSANRGVTTKPRTPRKPNSSKASGSVRPRKVSSEN